MVKTLQKIDKKYQKKEGFLEMKNDLKTFEQTKKDIQNLTGGKRERAEDLLNKAQFQSEELKKLQIVLKDKGWTEVYQNGNQSCVKKCTEGDVYNSLMKNYLATMKQINDMLPNQEEYEEDEFTKFLNQN